MKRNGFFSTALEIVDSPCATSPNMETANRSWGGKRSGCGRPKGQPNKRTREMLAKVEAGGIVPLDLMLLVMREHFAAGRFDEAAAIAKDAAPYCHPRLAAIEQSGPDGGPIGMIERTIVDVPQLHVHFVRAEHSEEE